MAATKKTPTKAPAKKSAAATRSAATTTASPKKQKKASPSTAKAAAKAPAASRSAAPKKASTRAAAVSKAPPSDPAEGIPAPRGTTKDGIAYTKDFDVKFLKAQHDALVSERVALTGQATRLEDEANSLIEDGEMGDVQFDDESGEGDTMVVERERDLALSAQARQTVVEIDAALERMGSGTYGYSVVSGLPIPRERLEAIPWATVLVEEKVGGIGRR